MVHHRNVARLRPRVGDRRARARRPRRRDRARRRRRSTTSRAVRRRAAADAARRHRPRRRSSTPSRRAHEHFGAARRRRQQRRLRPVRDGRGAQRGRRRATRSRRTCSARCGSPRRRCRSCASRAAGHILQVSSIGGISAFPGIGIYHASKWALEGISQALAAEVGDFGIHVTLIEPGGYSTDWGGSSARHAEPLAGLRRASARRPRAARARRSDAAATRTPPAAAILEIVDADEPPLRVFFGDGAARHREADYERRLATWREWQPVSSSRPRRRLTTARARHTGAGDRSRGGGSVLSAMPASTTAAPATWPVAALSPSTSQPARGADHRLEVHERAGELRRDPRLREGEQPERQQRARRARAPRPRRTGAGRRGHRRRALQQRGDRDRERAPPRRTAPR